MFLPYCFGVGGVGGVGIGFDERFPIKFLPDMNILVAEFITIPNDAKTLESLVDEIPKFCNGLMPICNKQISRMALSASNGNFLSIKITSNRKTCSKPIKNIRCRKFFENSPVNADEKKIKGEVHPNNQKITVS